MDYFDKQYHPPGTAPGTLIHSAEPEQFSIRLIDLRDDEYIEENLVSAEACKPYLMRDSKTWIQINGRADPATLRSLGEQFELHDLALEDVLNAGQRPKVDIYGDQAFVVMTLPRYDGDPERSLHEPSSIATEQISLFVGENYLICFNPLPEDIFLPIVKRMRPPNNQRFRNRGIDYLLYAMLDLVIDSGFPVLEKLGLEIEVLEEVLLNQPDRKTLVHIHQLKRELLLLRRMLWSHREAINRLIREDLPFIHSDTIPFLRDCYDHSIQIMDLLETFREMASGMLDVYLSSIGHRTNETMRVLTIIATIFIPLTFVAGIYGMNFEHPNSPWAMPELHWYYGYPIVLSGMLLISGGLLAYFRYRKWL
jgi:magnesium transporter